jgi:phage gp16-like protein
MSTRKVARSASSGRFISARDARRWPQYTVVETISYPSRRRFRRRSARHLTEENQMERPFKAGRDLRTVAAKKKRATWQFQSRQGRLTRPRT